MWLGCVWGVHKASTTHAIYLCLLYLWSMSMVDGAPVVQRTKRSTDSPCFVLDQAGDSASIPVIDTSNNIITRAEELHEYVSDTKDMIKQTKQFSTNLVDYLETQYFMDPEAALVNEENKQECVADSSAAMLKHYNQLYELVFQVEHMRTNGDISTLSNEAEMRARLLSIEKSIYSIICTIKLGLLSAGVDTTGTVTSSELSQDFLVVDGNYAEEFYRFYVVMADSERLLAYLNEMYTAVEASESES